MELTKRFAMLKLFSKHQIEPKTLAFGEAQTAEGLTLFYDGDTPEVGAAIFVLDPEGNYVAAPEGEHTLQDGTVLVVSHEDMNGMMVGIIKEVRPSEQPAEGEPAQEPVAATDAEQTDKEAKAIIRSIIEETRFSADISEELSYDEQVRALIGKYEAEVTGAEEKVESFRKVAEKKEAEANEAAELVAKMSEQPSTEPAHKKSRFFFDKGDKPEVTFAERMAKLRNLTK